MARIILIGGGSFQGKSLVSLEIGHRFKIPAIVCTDTIRSILHTIFPEDPRFFTSTYLMKPEHLNQQMKAVSTTIIDLIEIFEKRGESLILEGMHFDEQAIDYVYKKSNAILFCLDNKRSFIDRVLFKGKTRDKIEYLNPESGEVRYGTVSEESIEETSYMSHSNRILEIHNEIVDYFKRRGLYVIEFSQIDEAVDIITDIIMKQF